MPVLQEYEIPLLNIPFKVEGVYCKGDAGNSFNPPTPGEFNIHRVSIPALPGVEVSDLLEHIKANDQNGWELLETSILAIIEGAY